MKIRLLLFVFLFIISLHGYGQSCSLSVSISSSEPAICSGNSVTLTAKVTGGSGNYTYAWSTGETTNPISVNKAGKYSVVVTDNSSGCSASQKDFPMSVSPTPDAPIARSVTVCAGNSAHLEATAPGGSYQWYDADGNFKHAGATYDTDPVTASSTFYVQTTVNGCTSLRTAVQVRIPNRPGHTDAEACYGSPVTLSVSGGDNYRWYTSPTSTAVVHTGASFSIASLRVTITYYVEADINGCTSQRTPVTATVIPPPQPPVIGNVPGICSGSLVSLHASAPAGIIEWFAEPAGGVPLISSPDYTTPELTTTTTYYVQTTVNDCQSTRARVVVQVNPIPVAPSSQTLTTCYGASVHLTASAAPSGTYQWYADADGRQMVNVGNNYDTPPITQAITYYVANINSGCMSTLSPVNITVDSIIRSPSVIAPLTCYGSTATLTATSPGGEYKWYATATDNNVLYTGEEFVTPPLTASTTFYVQTTVGACSSERIAVTVPVIAQVTAPAVAPASICEGNEATLTATGPNGDYTWYDNAAGSNLLQVGKVFVTPSLLATTTYYVQVTVNGCQSKLTPVTVTVNSLPSAPVAGSEPAICSGDGAALSASVTGGGTISWFETEFGGQSVHSGNTYTTPPLSADKTYYVQNNLGSCSSARTAITVHIKKNTTTFKYSSGTFTTTGADPIPVISNPSAGTFSALPAGMVFINNTTGQIDVSATAVGKYKVTFTGSGTCSGTYSDSVRITDKPKTDFSYARPYCQDGTNPLPIFALGANPGVFTASPAGLVFVDKNTGEINLSSSKPGTYTVTNTIPASGSDPEVSSTAPVTINEGVVISAGPDKSVPTGTPVTLDGNISGGASGATWSGGTGQFSDLTNLHAVYTPAAGESIVKLTLRSDDPAGPCGPKSSTVTITFNTTPPAPTAQPGSVCLGDSTKLFATAPGGTYRWYQDAVGGSTLHTGAAFQTPQLTTSTTYYVETTLNRLTSPRTSVPVTVNGPPAAPIAPDTLTICSGSIAKLKASGSTGTYQWYTKTANGQSKLLWVGDTYTTSPLTATTNYFVQTVNGKCVSLQKQVVVKVNPVPTITSKSFDFACSGNPLNYTITANLPGATFTWSRKAVAGISNAEVTAQASATITETLINTTSRAINVNYVITPVNDSCSGKSLNYVVTVYPTPAVVSSKRDTICYGTTANYAIKFNTPGIIFNWSREAVPGISNAAVSGQAADTIREVLFNTTNAPLDVTYTVNYKTSNCPGTPFNWVVTVNPQVNITGDTLSLACSGIPQNYIITSNIPTATFTWQRDQVPKISNPAVSGQTTSTIDETLINTGTSDVNVTYIITPMAFGCTGKPFLHMVNVGPKPVKPVANSNSPVCVGNTIQLNTPSRAGATYMWTGPNGFSSTSQKPDIPATEAAAGVYNLFVTVGGCTSDASPVTVQVNQPPVAKANGPDIACTTVKSITLTGSVSGGTTTGVWSSSNPLGKFLPSPNTVGSVQYIPTDDEKVEGSVTITLSSTSTDDCTISTSSIVIKYGQEPGADAGPQNMNVCSQDTRIPLTGKVLVPGGTGFWTTAGDGTFESVNQPNAVYLPGDNDKKSGSVVLKFNVNNAGLCYTPFDSVKITFFAPPVLTTEHRRYVLKDKLITLHPTVSDETVTYLWTPNIGMSDVHVKDPVITGDIDRTYTLVVTDSLGCTASDTTRIVVSPRLFVNNAFSPNGDGKNDTWEITGLVAFENSTVDVYNRYGTQIFHSKGYGVPWDGNANGQPVPAGVYYFIVDTKVSNQRFTGYVTILR